MQARGIFSQPSQQQNLQNLTFLKDHQAIVEAEIRKVFSGEGWSNEGLFTGELETFRYEEINCADFTKIEPSSRVPSKKEGPGIQLRMDFGSPIGKKLFYYLESDYSKSESENIEELIRNLNTDFTFTQLIYAKQYQSLEIFFWQLAENRIHFKLEGRRLNAPMRDFYNVETREFFIKKFMKYKIGRRLRNQSAVEENAQVSSDSWPETITFPGVDKNELLSQMSEAPAKATYG